MKIKAIRWMGVETHKFAAMKEFAAKTLGLQLGSADKDFQELIVANGDRLELNGPAADVKPWEFKPNKVMVGFLVDDVHAARKELVGVHGVELLGDVQSEDGVDWQDFRAPDGNVYELTSDPPSK
jgi:hypothetical protein